MVLLILLIQDSVQYKIFVVSQNLRKLGKKVH